MSVRSPTAGTWSISQWRPDNEFETDRAARPAPSAAPRSTPRGSCSPARELGIRDAQVLGPATTACLTALPTFARSFCRTPRAWPSAEAGTARRSTGKRVLIESEGHRAATDGDLTDEPDRIVPAYRRQRVRPPHPHGVRARRQEEVAVCRSAQRVPARGRQKALTTNDVYALPGRSTNDMSLDRDFRFACPRWHLYTPESRRAHEILFGVQSSSSRGCASRIPNSLHDRAAVWPRWRARGDRGASSAQAATARLAPSSPAGATPTASDRRLFGFGSLFLSPGRIRKIAI